MEGFGPVKRREGSYTRWLIFLMRVEVYEMDEAGPEKVKNGCKDLLNRVSQFKITRQHRRIKLIEMMNQNSYLNFLFKPIELQ